MVKVWEECYFLFSRNNFLKLTKILVKNCPKISLQMVITFDILVYKNKKISSQQFWDKKIWGDQLLIIFFLSGQGQVWQWVSSSLKRSEMLWTNGESLKTSLFSVIEKYFFKLTQLTHAIYIHVLWSFIALKHVKGEKLNPVCLAYTWIYLSSFCELENPVSAIFADVFHHFSLNSSSFLLKMLIFSTFLFAQLQKLEISQFLFKYSITLMKFSVKSTKIQR
jgi:hypothetical protein